LSKRAKTEVVWTGKDHANVAV